MSASPRPASADSLIATDATPSRWSDAATLTALALLVLVAIALRAFRLGHQSLWFDEIVSWASAQGTPWHVITQRKENSNIPPLYYLVASAGLTLRGWLGVDTALRVPSVVVGVLSVPLLFVVVRWWLGPRLALLTAALMTVSPFHVWYSQEARPYALLLFLALAALACEQRALAHPDRARWKAAFAVLAAATFYCHTVGLAFIGFAAVYVLVATPGDGEHPPWKGGPVRQGWQTRRRLPWRPQWRSHVRSQWKSWAVTFAGVALLCLPAIYRLASLPPTVSADVERAFSPTQLGYALWTFIVGYSLGPSLGELHTPDRGAVIARYAMTVLPIGATLVALFAYGCWSLARSLPRSFAVIALWFFCPMAFAALGALVTIHPFNVRYTVISFLPAVVLLVCGLDALPTAPLRALAWAGILAVSASALRGYYFDPKYARDDNRGAGAFFTAHARPGELVLAHRAFTARDLEFYAPTTATRVVPFPPGRHSVTSTELATQLAATTDSAPRVWLFLSRGTPAEEAPFVAFCDAHFRRIAEFASSGVRLLGYARADTAPRPAGGATASAGPH